MNNKNLDLLIKDKLINIEYIKRTGNASMNSNHYHDHYELFYLLSGERFYFIKDKAYHIKKGDIVLIKPNELHKTIDAKNPEYQRILINFKKETINSAINVDDIELFSCFDSEIYVISLNLNEQNFLETLLFKMINENKTQEIGSQTYLKVLLIEILIFMNRLILQKQNINKSDILNKKVSEIISYINNSYNQELSIEYISKKFYISPYYFCHIFKKSTGFTFTQYLNIIRVKEAQILLKNSKMNITEIGEKVGFNSSTHFGRVFKNITGVSPHKYKK